MKSQPSPFIGPSNVRRGISALTLAAVISIAIAGCSSAGQSPSAPTTNTPTISATPTVADNGISSMTIREILTKARSALDSATSFHVRNEDHQNGATTVADIVISGSDFKGTVTTEGVPVEFISVGDALYVKGDDWWKQKTGSDMKGKYARIITSKSEFARTTVSMFGRANYTGMLGELIADSSSYTKGYSTATGRPAVVLYGNGNSIFVASTGEPYPLRLQGGTVVIFDFDDFDATVDINVPPGSETIEINPR